MDAPEQDLEQRLALGDAAMRTAGDRAHALLVAGMHRAGTSAITRVMSLRGIDLPRTLAPGVPDNNDLGFWESVPVAAAHDRFLASVGSAWDDVSPIPRSVFSSPRAQEFAAKLERILRDEYGDSTLFVVKDPRLCRLIPVWVSALEHFDARPSFVITTRNPLEVAGSLRARDGFSATKSCLLWLRHLLDAEHDTRGFPRVFVSYEQLLRDWVTTMDQIARELHLFWPRSDHETNLQIEGFLSSALRHHSFECAELRARSDVVEWVAQAYEAVSHAAADADELDRELFDEIRGQLNRADQAYGPLLAQARGEVKKHEAARGEAEAQLTAAVGRLAEEQEGLKALRADNQLVRARLVDEMGTVGRLRRVVEGLAKTLAELSSGLSDAGGTLLLSERQPAMLRGGLEQLLAELRQRATAPEEPEDIRRTVDHAIGRIEEFLHALDDDRARLLDGLLEREAQNAEQTAQRKTLEVESRRIVDALVARGAELAGALRRAEAAEADAAAQAEALRSATEEREFWANESTRLSAVVDERDGSLSRRTRDYEELRDEALRLAVAVADAETELGEMRTRLEAAAAEGTALREDLAEREATLAEALARHERSEGDGLARVTSLEDVLAERDRTLSEAHKRVETAEGLLRSLAIELDQARDGREAWLVEAKRLSGELDERERRLAETRQALEGHEAELSDARRELESLQVSLERAVAGSDARLAENEQLKLALTEQGEALSLAQAERAHLTRLVEGHEERSARTLEEARQLAAALAEGEEELSRKLAELCEVDEQLRVAKSEAAARDELLARSSEQVEGLKTDLRLRDEALATQSELLAQLELIGKRRTRRWRSFTQFCSWFLPPTASHRGYIKAYLRLRRSDFFDPDFYLSCYPDVSHAGLNPLMHYIEHGLREGRHGVRSANANGLSPTPELARTTLPALAAGLALDDERPADGAQAADGAQNEHERPSEDGAGAAEDNAFTERLLQALAEHAPATAAVAVATGGSEDLLSIPGCRTCHFPRTLDGAYGGDNASGCTALIANLEAMRATGTAFLYVPTCQRTLLERNARFHAHLLGRYSRVIDSEELGTCFALQTQDAGMTWRLQLSELADWVERETGGEASILDWGSGLQLEPKLHGCNVSTFSGPELPHLDESVDVVAVTACSEEQLAEARRVARHGVLEVPGDGRSPHFAAPPSLTEHAPTVSIVIPVHEQLAHTRACVRALDETLPTWFRGEILIVDDASSGAAVAGLRRLAESNPQIRLVQNEVNVGFLASVNRTVQEAQGEFIVLLNNDTIPLPGWLTPLLTRFRAQEEVGAVGGRLVYPDGRLQEAGGLVFRDGSAAKFGYGDPEPDFPLFTVPREVDYCSGCLLTFRRDFFLESGGFDSAYGFGFYEDTDFCFRVRALGRVVLYEPESVIVHVEGASAGTDLTRGAKRFQALNASLFAERWHEALKHQPERPAELDRAALQSLTRRPGSP